MQGFLLCVGSFFYYLTRNVNVTIHVILMLF